MTRKHFVELARVLKNMKPPDSNRLTKKQLAKEMEVWENMCNQLADFCSTFNYSFDRYRFLSACGVDE